VATKRDRRGIGRRRRTGGESVRGTEPVAQSDDATTVGADPGGDRAADDPAETTTQASLDEVLRQAAEARAVQRDGEG
jgi:hypothetical protein